VTPDVTDGRVRDLLRLRNRSALVAKGLLKPGEYHTTSDQARGPETAFGEVPEDWGTLSRHRDLNSVICTSRTANERHARGLQFPAPRLHETDPPDRLSKIDGRDPAL
jgi:hypothetical protein